MTSLIEQTKPEQRVDRPPRPWSDGDSRWRAWPRRLLACLLLLAAAGSWLAAQTYTLVLVVPMVVAAASVVQRGVAAAQGRLELGFVRNPLAAGYRPFLAQLALRTALAGLVMAGAAMAIVQIEVDGLPGAGAQWAMVVVPLVVFVALQLLPSRPVSRSLNVVAAVVALFLAFQLFQVNYRSSTDDAVDIAAPFDGQWYVGSGGRSTLINHHYTPLADQRYAVDLVIEKDGRTVVGDRSELASFYCWDQPILAPADGVVVAAENDHRDWPVGESDPVSAGGNVVVIDIGDGRYVQLAHLRMGSIPVTVGQAVSVGDEVGRCGNSGNTAEPHLHMQVQDSPKSVNAHQAQGAVEDLNTFPFRFTNVTHIRDGEEYSDQTTQLRRNDRVRTDS